MRRISERPKLVSVLLAIVFVFMMTTGALAGAVNENLDFEEENSLNKTCILTDAGETLIREIDPYNLWVESEESEETGEEANKNLEQIDSDPEFSEDEVEELFSEKKVVHSTSEGDVIADPKTDVEIKDNLKNNMEFEYITTFSRNEFSDALSYIIPTPSDQQVIEKKLDPQSVESSETNSRALLQRTILLGTDNPNQAGVGSGYIYRYGTSHSITDAYYMYCSDTPTTEFRGFSVFDLSDLLDYEGITINSGSILFRSHQRFNVLSANYYSLDTIPEDGVTGTKAMNAFSEAGGINSVKLSSFSSSTENDLSPKDIYLTISSGGISEINKKIATSNFAFAIGADITKISTTYTYSSWYSYDIRLLLNFSFSSMPVMSNDIAVADELAGYASSSILYDHGYVYTSNSDIRGFTVWSMADIKPLIPPKSVDGSSVKIKKVAVRLNTPSSSLQSLGIYPMTSNPQSSTASTIYKDAGDGTPYVSFPTTQSKSLNTIKEYEWDLGTQGLLDFKDSYEDQNPNYFALGFSRTTSSDQMYNPKLVVYYELKAPPKKSYNLGPDNPEYAGDAHGYVSYASGSSFYSISAQDRATFEYLKSTTSGTFEWRGYMVYDLEPLRQYTGIKIESAYLVARNWERTDVDELQFARLTTIPHGGITSSRDMARIFNQAGGVGSTIIAKYSPSTSSDTTPSDIKITINGNGINELNNVTGASLKYYTFAIGGMITKMPSGKIAGKVDWRDIRLVVTFSYTKDPLPTSTSVPGLPFGDDLSGVVHSLSGKFINIPGGRLNITQPNGKGEYRGYCQWSSEEIMNSLPDKDLIITGLKLAVNNDVGKTNFNITHMKYNVKSSTVTDAQLYADCGDGTHYAIFVSSKGNDEEIIVDLGTNAPKDFMNSLGSTDKVFGLGFDTDKNFATLYGPKLVVEWKYKPPDVLAKHGGPYFGFEGSAVMLNANQSRNLTNGTGGLEYSWDLDYDGVFDKTSSSPYLFNTWNDDYVGKITLRVNDTVNNATGMTNTSITISNVAPVIKCSSGTVTPQPAWESDTITFKDFQFTDPGDDSWSYFWDFDNDGILDASGSTSGKNVPSETWLSDDDFYGNAVLVVVDDDSGSSNTTISKKGYLGANSGDTGYVFDTGITLTGSIYVYQYDYFDIRRGWAKIDLSTIPVEAEIMKVELNGYIGSDYSVDSVDIRELTTDPATSIGNITIGKTVFSEAGSGTLLGSIPWKLGWFTVEFQAAGVAAVQNALTDKYVGLGFDYTKPDTSGLHYGWMYGDAYSNYPLVLTIEYKYTLPGCMIPIKVENKPPKIDCSGLKITPTTIDENQEIAISNLNFTDPGNDTYEYNVSIGGRYWSGWISLGDPDEFGGWGLYGPGDHNYTLPIVLTVPDDHPKTGTSWDDVTIRIYVRDDDHDVLIPGTGLLDVEGPHTVQDTGVTSATLGYNNGRNLVVDSRYNIYVLYRATLSGDKANQIYLAKSSDAGESWEHLKVSNELPHFIGSTQNFPSLAIDSQDVLHAVWSGIVSTLETTNIFYARSSNGGLSWDHYNVTMYSEYARYDPSIAVDSSGNAHIAWYGRNNGTYGNNIQYRCRFANGTWGSETMVTKHLSTANLPQNRPSIQVDTKDNVYVAWHGHFSSSLRSNNIQYAVKSSTGSWGSPNTITSDSTNYHVYPSVATDTNDDVHVVWFGRDSTATGSYNIMYAKYDSSASSWGSREHITKYTTTGYQQFPTVAVNGDGDVDVLWFGYSMPTGTSPNIIRHAQKTSAGWSSDVDYYSNGSNNQYYPDLLHQTLNVKVQSGFAYVWMDRSKLMFDTSDDFELGKAEYTDGLDWCDKTVRVNNVAPVINMTGLSPGVAYEQINDGLYILFKDPAIFAPTEQFEYRINWGDGSTPAWTAAPAGIIDELFTGRNPATGSAVGTTLVGEYSFNNQPITYMWASFRSSDDNTYDITISGFNMNTLAWETLFDYQDSLYPGDFERSYTTPIYTRWRIEFADYEMNDNIFFNYKFETQGFSFPGYSYLRADFMYADDMPTATPEDKYKLLIEVRDDDLGSDSINFEIMVKSLPPQVLKGIVTPDMTYGIDEGTVVKLKCFSFDDIAFAESTETFEYEVAWGDGQSTGWKSDFTMSGAGAGEVETIQQNVYTSSTTSNGNGRKLVMDSKGSLYAIMSYSTTSSGLKQVFLETSDDYGATWTRYQVTTDKLSVAGNQLEPSIAIDSNDVLHAVWRGAATGYSLYNIRYANSVDGGITWDNFTMVTEGTSTPNYHYSPSIDVDSNNDIHIVWHGESYLTNSYDYNIHYISRSSAGSWSTITMITNDMSDKYHQRPSLAIDSSDNLHVVWTGYVGTGNTLNIQYRKYDSSTSTWGSTKLLTSSTGGGNYRSESPVIVADAADNLHVAWSQRNYVWWKSAMNIRYQMYSSTTSTWESIMDVTQNTVYSNLNPTLSTDGCGRIYLAWSGGSPYTLYLAERCSGSLGWSISDITPNIFYSSQYYPSLLVAGPNSYPECGTAIVWTGMLSQFRRYDVLFYGTDNLFLGFGPYKGIPVLEHLYRDDKPSNTERDIYQIKIKVRDDDLVIGEHVIEFEIRNILPEITSDISLVMGTEGSLLLPEVEFKDSGSNYPAENNERWTYWWDLNGNGLRDAVDITGTVTDVTVIDNVSYCTVPAVTATYNDDYNGTATLFVYDDDMRSSWKYTSTIFKPGYRVIDSVFEAYMDFNVWEKINWSKLYADGSTTYCMDMSVYQNLASWQEDYVNWTNYAPSTSNLNYVPEDTLPIEERRAWLGPEFPANGKSHWEPFDIPGLTQEWLEDTADNYGITIMPTMVGNNLVAWEHTVYYSSDIEPGLLNTRPKLTIDIDTDFNGIPDTSYFIQPDGDAGKDAWIAQCSLDLTATQESGFGSPYLLPNLMNTAIGYSSIGSYYRRGLIEFNLSGIAWLSDDTELWVNPPFSLSVEVIVKNLNPIFSDNTPKYHLPGDLVVFDISMTDPGSDDLSFMYDMDDGAGFVFGGEYFNDGIYPDKYPSPFTGTAPFSIKPDLEYSFYLPGTHYVNFTIWDDDGGVTNATVEIKIMTAYEMKEEAVRLLEPLVPGRWDHVGYQNLTLKFLGVKDPTVLAYNHISREPYYWETKLLYTFCNVDPGEIIFVDASTLPTGMFGDKLILKTYDEECGLVDETEIPTAYSCLNILKPGQRYGPWEIVEVGLKNGTTYQHYTRFAREVEDAMDNILFSIGKDPRRGYGWWHTHWIWYCGYWFERTLWIDDSRLDPQYGTIVFCEERNAVKHLMSVINNCLNCDGVHNMTLQWTGKEKVDIEVYSYGLWWKWYNQWEHTHSFEEIAPGDTFFIGSRGYPLCGKLAKRTMIKIHKYNTGELLDAVYMRTSGFWPLEVEPGNLYGNVLIVNTTLKLGCGNFYFYDPWFTDDYWHDWGWQPWYGDESAFDHYDWQVSRSSQPVSRSKQCGWTEDCWDDAIAAEEETRICSNLSVIKTVIKLLVLADELIARVAHWDAQNLTANVVTNQDEYEYHLKMAKRYMLRARREANEGKPHRAIRDYKLSWKNSMLAMRWVVKDFEDFNGTVDPGVSEKWADFDIECYCMCGDGNQGVKTPWWLWFYMLNQWRYKMRFAFFPNWREFTDPEVWGGDPNETYEYEGDECNDPSYRAVEKSMYIGYEDYYSDYDYNDWGMKLYEKRHVKTNTNKIGKLELRFVADAKEAGYKHYIHLAINLESNVEYTWEMKFYDEEDNLQSTQESSGVSSGDFDERLFDTAKYPWGHDLKPKYVVVIIDFEEDIFPMHLSQAPYDTYMYVRTTGKYIHSYTTRPTTESEASGSDPSLADKYVPMMLVVDDDAWEPPMDGQRIWKKYDKFDDWVLKGYPGNENWWD